MNLHIFQSGTCNRESHERSVLRFVIAFLQRSVFPEEIHRLKFFDHKLSTVHQLFYFLRIRDVFVLHESRFKTLPEVCRAFWIVPAKIQKLLESWRK